jgi:hypothetical protein
VDAVQPAERHLYRQTRHHLCGGLKNHDGWKRGIRIGTAKDGSVTAFIPDPVEKSNTTSAAEGVAADVMGNIYGAEVGPKRMMKYVKQ